MFLFVVLATLIGTTLGSILALFSKKLPKEILNFLHNFSVGALLGLIFIELIPEALKNMVDFTEKSTLGVVYSLLIICGSGLLFFGLHELVHLLSHHHDHDHNDEEECHDHAHTKDLIKGESLLTETFIFLSAIFVHNIPEGFALGSTFAQQGNAFPINGLITSIVLFIHNLLIGFIMCNSFLDAQKSRRFSVFFTILSSLPACVLAIVGYFISSFDISNIAQAIIFSISSGSLLYVLFVELLQQTFKEYKSKCTFIYVLLGLALCILLIFIGE